MYLLLVAVEPDNKHSVYLSIQVSIYDIHSSKLLYLLNCSANGMFKKSKSIDLSIKKFFKVSNSTLKKS